jgi:hypothetical protein
MKSHTIEWSHIEATRPAAELDSARRLNRILGTASRAFLAIVPALAIVVGAAWLANTPELTVFLQASLWAAGFLFLGLALDSDTPVNVLHLATGLVLPTLALLSSSIAVELAIVASVLVAAWIAAGIFRR